MEQSSTRASLVTNLGCVALIIAVALVPRLIVLNRTVAPCRDAFKYIDAAQVLSAGWTSERLQSLPIHFLYPACLEKAHAGLNLVGISGPRSWVIAGQLVSLTAYLGFLIVAFFAGQRLWNTRVALLGCLAVSMVRREIVYSVDVLSDTLTALLWMASFAVMVHAWRGGRSLSLLSAGLFAGLAYWSHLGALIIPCVFVASLTVTQLWPAWRMPWKRAGAMAMSFGVSYALTLGLFVQLTGSLSPRPAAHDILGADLAMTETTAASETAPLAVPIAEPPAPALAPTMTLAAYEGQTGYERLGLLGSAWLVLKELGSETKVWLLLLAVWALLDRRGSKLSLPAGTLVLFSILGTTAMLIYLKMKCGYVAGRYGLAIMPLIGMLGITGAEAIVRRLQDLPPLPWENGGPPGKRLAWARISMMIFVGIAVGTTAKGWFEPLHVGWHGHMSAARWIAEHTDGTDVIFDPVDYAGFFADRPRWKPSTQSSGPLPCRYAIVEPERVGRFDPTTYEAIRHVARIGRPVASFPRKPGSSKDTVVVVELPIPPNNLSQR
ncbi:hypothetical protein Pan216_57960 [Planctomycetes bacterium Pan216]|uniref:Glycosyltransferase RgtA/B/C/D-like domain-containing protein n=1 Tax=Kolteria novifilia TaxID=2527975 RepID=A0A518BD44_9BACT|nr:hypothetical protein Pan216_57960 [Planctomycetes bacterium Pan216]